MKFYKCQKCPNMIAYLEKAVCNARCCGEEMLELVPNTSDGAGEKHVPVLERAGQTVTVKVGSIAHPMLEEHSIRWIALETNGMVAPPRPDLFDYIAVSPKAEFADRYNDRQMLSKADEVRIVCSSRRIADFCKSMRKRIQATDYYISPLSRHGRMDVAKATALMDILNEGLTEKPWMLSVQTHKLIGIR